MLCNGEKLKDARGTYKYTEFVFFNGIKMHAKSNQCNIVDYTNKDPSSKYYSALSRGTFSFCCLSGSLATALLLHFHFKLPTKLNEVFTV